MAKWKLCPKANPPAIEVEAETLEAAEEKAREDLHDWADDVELDSRCDEAEPDGKQH